MSWFHFTVSGKHVWDSHSYVTSLVTGQVVGKFVMDNGVKKSVYYQAIREKISLFLGTYISDKLTPYNKTVAAALLDESINKTAIAQVSNSLKDRLSHLSKADLVKAFKGGVGALKLLSYGTFNYLSNPEIYKNYFLSLLHVHQLQMITREDLGTLSHEDVEILVGQIQENYSKEDSVMLFNLLKEFKLTDFVCKAVILSLKPTCEKAVKAAITSVGKAGVGIGVDFTVRKVITIASLPVFYGIVRSIFQVSSEYIPQNQVTQTISETAESYLPSVSTVIWGSAAVHLGIAGYLFWDTVKDASNKEMSDKEEIKQLAIRLSKNSIARKIEEHSLLRSLGIKLDAETIDQLSMALIEQAIEFYWPKLNETKFLGIPLVN